MLSSSWVNIVALQCVLVAQITSGQCEYRCEALPEVSQIRSLPGVNCFASLLSSCDPMGLEMLSLYTND